MPRGFAVHEKGGNLAVLTPVDVRHGGEIEKDMRPRIAYDEFALLRARYVPLRFDGSDDLELGA